MSYPSYYVQMECVKCGARLYRKPGTQHPACGKHKVRRDHDKSPVGRKKGEQVIGPRDCAFCVFVTQCRECIWQPMFTPLCFATSIGNQAYQAYYEPSSWVDVAPNAIRKCKELDAEKARLCYPEVVVVGDNG